MSKIIFIAIFFITSASLCADSSTSSSSDTDNSDQIKILYERAKVYIEEDNFKKSLKVLKTLTKREDLAGFRADIYNLLGFSYRKLNKPDLDKSFAAYMMAIELEPAHIGAHEYLGELYLMLENQSKALEILAKLEVLAGKSSKEYLDLEKAIKQY